MLLLNKCCSLELDKKKSRIKKQRFQFFELQIITLEWRIK